jgi:hypothetical protein
LVKILLATPLRHVDCEFLCQRVSYACSRTRARVLPSLLWHTACCSRV